MWIVTRHRYWDINQLGIQLSPAEVIGHTDMLPSRYRDEGVPVRTLTEALEVAKSIMRAWRIDTDEPIRFYVVERQIGDYWQAVEKTVAQISQLAHSEVVRSCGNCGSKLPSKPLTLTDEAGKSLMPDCCSVECQDELFEKAFKAYGGGA